MSVATPSLLNELRDLVGRWSTSQRLIVVRSADLADSVEWVSTGALSPAHWLADVAQVEVCTAREWIRIGCRLRDLRASADAFDDGTLSYAKIRTLTRGRRPDEGPTKSIASANSAEVGGNSRAASRCTSRASTSGIGCRRAMSFAWSG